MILADIHHARNDVDDRFSNGVHTISTIYLAYIISNLIAIFEGVIGRIIRALSSLELGMLLG